MFKTTSFIKLFFLSIFLLQIIACTKESSTKPIIPVYANDTVITGKVIDSAGNGIPDIIIQDC